MRETKTRASSVAIFIVLTAIALSLAMPRTSRAEDPIAESSASSPPDSTSDVSSTTDVSSADRKLIELNKVLVIPQKCSPNDGMMNCDPDQPPALKPNSSNDSNATNDDANSNPSADEDSFDNKTPADVAAEPTSTSDDDDDGAVANSAPASPSAVPSPNEPDISNPDTPLPDASAQGNPTVASNDPNGITPQYGTLEDYRSQEDAAMETVPAPIYVGSVSGVGGGVPFPTYVNPVGGAFAAARVYTPTFRPPFGPAGPWMTPPSAMFVRPGLAAAPMARPAGRSFGFHH